MCCCPSDEAGHLLGEYTTAGNRVAEYVWMGDVLVGVGRKVIYSRLGQITLGEIYHNQDKHAPEFR